MDARDNAFSKTIAMAGFILLDMRTVEPMAAYRETLEIPGVTMVVLSARFAENETVAQKCVNAFLALALAVVLAFPWTTHMVSLAVPAAVMLMIAVDDPGPKERPPNPDDYIALYDSDDAPEETDVCTDTDTDTDTDYEPEEVFGNVV